MPLAFGLWYVWGGLLGLLWLICLLSAGVLCWKNGHKVMFFIGFLVPILWIVGAIWSKPAVYQPGMRP
jgi:hypothetical protein